MDLPNNSDNMPTPNSEVHQSASQTPSPIQFPAQNATQNTNPFSDPLPQPQPQPDLLFLSRSGTSLITNITKYLSTLAHPIEIVEELVAVCAVTSSLATSLHSTILRFPHLNLSPTHSFIAPLCHDILYAFKLLGSCVQEAKRLRVFEPNSVGLVRLPRAAWTLVLGTEAKVAALRSRLYVEKYRVRVLIEAVAWEGLRVLGGGRTKREDEEWRSLNRMLGLVAERLVGVQRDYRPRLLRARGVCVDEKVISEPMGVAAMRTVVVPVLIPAPVPVHAPLAPTVLQKAEVEVIREPSSEKSALRPSSSSSTSSSLTLATSKDNIYETWLLRCNRLKKDLRSRTSLFGIPLLSTHTYTAATYYVKPSLSSAAETASFLQSCYTAHGKSEFETPEEHLVWLRTKVLNMPDDAQWEIQKLIEARQKACSSEKVCREWEVIGLLERNRRRISPPVGKGGKKWWSLRKQKKVVEWVLVLKGETVDCKERVMPGKHENAWKAVDEVKEVKEAKTAVAPVQIQRPLVGQCAQQQQQQGTVLRHVENRRALSPDEAESKMREIIADLFVQEEEVKTDSEDESGEDDEEIESDEDEDEEELGRN